MGHEGFKADMYMVRPSFETFKQEGFTFKLGYRAVVQMEEGYSNPESLRWD